MVCLLCLNEADDGVSIYGKSEEALNARDLIAAHFWFDVSYNFMTTFFLDLKYIVISESVPTG